MLVIYWNCEMVRRKLSPVWLSGRSPNVDCGTERGDAASRRAMPSRLMIIHLSTVVQTKQRARHRRPERHFSASME
jgi:hypothetical protein